MELEPDCIIEEELPDGSTRHVEACLRDENGYLIDLETGDYQIPPDVHVCYATLVDDTTSTPSTHDDMSPECTDQHFNLEFEIASRPGYAVPGGTRVTATCSLSEYPSISCPGLDD